MHQKIIEPAILHQDEVANMITSGRLALPVADRGTLTHFLEKHKLKCVQIKLNNCKAANLELITYISKHKIDIALIQDYHKSKGNFTGLPQAWSIYHSTLQTAAILITNSSLYHVESLKLDNSIFINISIAEDPRPYKRFTISGKQQ